MEQDTNMPAWKRAMLESQQAKAASQEEPAAETAQPELIGEEVAPEPSSVEETPDFETEDVPPAPIEEVPMNDPSEDRFIEEAEDAAEDIDIEEPADNVVDLLSDTPASEDALKLAEETASENAAEIEAKREAELEALAEEEAAAAKAKKMSTREIVFIVIAVLAFLAAIYAFVSGGAPAGAAAKVGDTIITEQEVEAQMATTRSTYGMEDSATWASALMGQSITPQSLRLDVINDLVKKAVYKAEATKLNCLPTDDEIQAEVDSNKTAMNITSDEDWVELLEQYGYTEESFKQQISDSLISSKLSETAVAKPEGYDEAQTAAEAVETDDDGNAKKSSEQDILDKASSLSTEWSNLQSAYLANLVNNAQVTIYPMPTDASYNVDLSLAYTSTDSSSEATDDSEATEDGEDEEEVVVEADDSDETTNESASE